MGWGDQSHGAMLSLQTQPGCRRFDQQIPARPIPVGLTRRMDEKALKRRGTSFYQVNTRTIRISIRDRRDWNDVFASAHALWEQYRFEDSVACCLDYLHRHLKRPALNALGSIEAGEEREGRQMKIIFACGGRGARWGRFMNTSKHRVDTGDGLPLVQRSVIQFLNAFPLSQCYVLVGEDQLDEFADVEYAGLMIRHLSSDQALGLEILDHRDVVAPGESDILWVHGDVFFADHAVGIIQEKVSLDVNGIRMFGRKRKNLKYQNDYGEGFAWYVPFVAREAMLDWHLLARRIYEGTRMKRLGSWEVVSLISYAKKQGFASPLQLLEAGRSPAEVYKGLTEIFNQRAFDPDIWVEIDDETEDFDYPFEYIRRLMWRVGQIGVSAK
jgi:hypothetical protein